jgi:hypothetical protein
MPAISIIDDDESVREGAMDLFKSMGFITVAFPCATDFNRHGTVEGRLISSIGICAGSAQPGGHDVGQIAENEPHIDGSIDPGRGQDGEVVRRRPRRKLLDGADR